MKKINKQLIQEKCEIQEISNVLVGTLLRVV